MGRKNDELDETNAIKNKETENDVIVLNLTVYNVKFESEIIPERSCNSNVKNKNQNEYQSINQETKQCMKQTLTAATRDNLLTIFTLV